MLLLHHIAEAGVGAEEAAEDDDVELAKPAGRRKAVAATAQRSQPRPRRRRSRWSTLAFTIAPSEESALASSDGESEHRLSNKEWF